MDKLFIAIGYVTTAIVAISRQEHASGSDPPQSRAAERRDLPIIARTVLRLSELDREAIHDVVIAMTYLAGYILGN